MKTYEINTNDGGMFGHELYIVPSTNIVTAIERALRARQKKANKLRLSRRYGIYVISAKEVDAFVATK